METYILICLDDTKYIVTKAYARLQVTQQTEKAQVTQVIGSFRASDTGRYWMGLDEFLSQTGVVPVFDWHNYATVTATIREISAGLGLSFEDGSEILAEQGIEEHSYA